jgi:hypothetical protein
MSKQSITVALFAAIFLMAVSFTSSAKECSIHSRYLERLGWR